jgi:hypothetical protein
MRVTLLTLQESDNYGAVWQAYALKTHLEMLGHTVTLPPITPRAIYRRGWRRFIGRSLGETAAKCISAYKRRSFDDFRARYLYGGRPRPLTADAILARGVIADGLVVGSDQVWNPNTISRGSPDRELFWLSFATPSIRRVAYAASFGVTQLSPDDIADLGPRARAFNAIGVRENTGLAIVDSLGCHGEWTIDPTLLLPAAHYEAILGSLRPASANLLYQYQLHWPTAVDIRSLSDALSDRLAARVAIPFPPHPFRDLARTTLDSPLQWLASIVAARFVVTNSFHGVAMCTLFRKPFAVVPLEGHAASMNTRIESFLARVGLQSRIVTDSSAATVDRLVTAPVDWNAVGQEVNRWRDRSAAFLRDALADSSVGALQVSRD